MNEDDIAKLVTQRLEKLVSSKYFDKFPTPDLLTDLKKDIQKTFPYFTKINVTYNFDGHFMLTFVFEDESYGIRVRPSSFCIPY